MAKQENNRMITIEQNEFERLQTQLIELRTTNYTLKDQHTKQTAEISRLREAVNSTSQELEKANKVIQKSKKAKDTQTLVEENEGLLRKLQDQEQDFKLQNQTLMQELGKVCEENQVLKTKQPKVSDEPSEELVRLRAENTVLQKTLQEAHHSEEGSVGDTDPKTKVAVNEKVLKLEVRLATVEEEKKRLQKRLEDLQESARQEQAKLQNEIEKWSDKTKKKQDSLVLLQAEKEKLFNESRASFEDMVRSKDHDIQALTQQMSTMSRDAMDKEAKLTQQIDTMRNEKEELGTRNTKLTEEREALLRERERAKTSDSKLQQQIEMLKSEKESLNLRCTKLTEEREAVLREREKLKTSDAKSAQLLDTVRNEKEELNNRLSKLTEERETLIRERDRLKSSDVKVAQQTEALRAEKEELNLRCHKLSEERDSIAREKASLQSVVAELGHELHQTKSNQGEERQQLQYLKIKLEEAKALHEQLADQAVKASEEKLNLNKELETVQKLAEKRKGSLDELAIKSQEAFVEYKKKLEDMDKSHKEQMQVLCQELEADQGKVRQLKSTVDQLLPLRARMEALEGQLKEADQTVTSLNDSHAKEKEGLEAAQKALQESHEKAIATIGSEKEALQQEVRSIRDELEKVRTTHEEEKQKQMSAEKKSNSLVKDLKRQLQQMKKYEQSLEEQLNIQRPNSPARGPSSLTASRDNLLMVARNNSSMSKSTLDSIPSFNSSPTSDIVSEEMKELMDKVATLQQDKWRLEERLQYLESTGSALAEDVINKSEIIKAHYMEGRGDHHTPSSGSKMVASRLMSPMKLIPWGKEKEEGGGGGGEINRKMQKALEEALMKNIHLQQNVDLLSSQLEKYTKGGEAEGGSPRSTRSGH